MSEAAVERCSDIFVYQSKGGGTIADHIRWRYGRRRGGQPRRADQPDCRNSSMPLKAELHCHIEGAASPELVIAQAQKYGKDVSPFIKDGSFVWHDFTSFLAAYDFAVRPFPHRGGLCAAVGTLPDQPRPRRRDLFGVLHLAGSRHQGRSVAAGLYRRAGRRNPARQGEDRHRRADDRHRRAPCRRRGDRAGGALRRQMRASAGDGFRRRRRRAHGRFRGLCACLRDRARGGARHHHPCRRADGLGERRRPRSTISSRRVSAMACAPSRTPIW